jgi:Peptidase C13 family
MVSVWSVFKLAARAAVWRTTPDPPLVGLPALLGWTLALAVVRVTLQYAAAAGAPVHFNPYGLNAIVAWLAFQVAVAAFFVRPAGRATALSAMFILSIIADIVAAAVQLGGPLLASAAALNAFWTRAIVGGAVFTIEIIWWLGAMSCVLGSIEPNSRLRLIARAAALWVALFAAHALMPDAPVFVTRDFDIRSANWWEYVYARYGAHKEALQIEQAQPRLLKAEVDRLAPLRNGATNIYVIGLAGWADQDVFIKELDGALTSIAAVLPIKDRALRLINNRETISTVPLANLQNFTAAVHAVGEAMNKAEDVLLLVMTSHGEQTGFALQLPGSVTAELTPQQVATTLDAEGIKNRVVIVSACYAGIFVAPLENDNTIVMAASDDKSTSFGCAPERDWTYFGDALFRQSLQPGADFQQAFDHARILIHGWELMDRVQPSNPQGYFGPALVAKLAPLFASPQRPVQ